MTNTRALLSARGWFGLILVLVLAAPAGAAEAKPPAVGDVAKDFELPLLAGGNVKLSAMTDAGPVVLVVLRGYPGYQCPACTRQVGDFIKHADAIKAAGASVLFVYPGPADELKKHAAEFNKDTQLPDHFKFALDPGYTFTNLYNLRWDEPQETAYPATFILNRKREITFANISKTHGGRVLAKDVVTELGKK